MNNHHTVIHRITSLEDGKERMDWCKANCKGRFSYSSQLVVDSEILEMYTALTLHFDNEEDRVMYKLTLGDTL